MRTRGVQVVAGSLTALVAAASLAASATANAAGHSRRRTLAENRAAARASAKALLGDVTLPSGSVRLTGAAKPPDSIVASSASALDEARWRVSGDSPQQVIAYVQANPPRGGSASGSGSYSTPTGSGLDVMFAFKNVPGVIDQQLVEVTASAAAGGGSDVTVESDSVWVVPRTRASLIPAGTRSIRVRVTNTQRASVATEVVTAAGRTRATVRFFNHLEAVQPFDVSCPAQRPTGDTLTLTFDGGGGHALAEATWREIAGGTSGLCSPVSLTVGGRAEDGVYGGDYLKSLDRLLGLKLPG